MTGLALAPEPLALPSWAGNRGRWRVTAHRRAYTSSLYPRDTIIGELADARSRRLTQAWNKPATFVFTVDGHSPSAAAVQEMTTDIFVWRYDDTQQRDICMFRGIVAQGQDTLSEQTATVTFTCHDYLAMLGRRFYTSPNPVVWANTDQDTIAQSIVNQASVIVNGANNLGFSPACFLPLNNARYDPAGNFRGLSGQLRDRTYPGQTSMLDALDKLATVANGFDYACEPGGASSVWDVIAFYYPYQGIQRTTPQLMYGTTVSALTRTFNSADYANYQRTVGNSATAAANAPQLFGEAWNADANNVTVAPQGLWMDGDLASDVSVQTTLNDHVNGQLSRSGVVVPNYNVTLRPGWFSPGVYDMGDVVPLIIQAGRLNVNTSVRVLGFDYDIGDDGQEDVILTLGRPDVTITDLFTTANADVQDLARR